MGKKKLFGRIIKLGAIAGGFGSIFLYTKRILQKETDMQKRYRTYYELTNQWLLNKSEKTEISEYFRQNSLKKIAIYGMGTLGELLYKDLKNEDIEVVYFIDKDAEEMYYGLDDKPVINMEDINKQKEVDAIIVTPIYDMDSIEESLRKLHVENTIISLEDVIYGI